MHDGRPACAGREIPKGMGGGPRCAGSSPPMTESRTEEETDGRGEQAADGEKDGGKGERRRGEERETERRAKVKQDNAEEGK